MPGRPKEKADAIHQLVDDGVLIRQDIDRAKFGEVGVAKEAVLVEEKARELRLIE